MDAIADKGKTDISSLGCNVSFDTWGHVSYCLHTFFVHFYWKLSEIIKIFIKIV